MIIPTEEQAAILNAAKHTSDNIMVNALAGAAKTTTLELICRAIVDIPILSLAFNKRIADEMKRRLPSHVEVKTLNALGHAVWGKVIGQRISIDTKKSMNCLSTVIRALPKGAQGPHWSDMADTLQWLRYAKRDGYVPAKWRQHAVYSVGTTKEWLAPYPEEPGEDQLEIIDLALCASIEAAYAGGLDFDDQIYMPVCFGALWPKFPLVLIDEFQDLNELQHAMLDKLVTKRLIGVGDPWQSIYGFRGAVQNGMAAATERWNMREMGLSISFRVPRAGVIRARDRVPHMQWRPDAPEGTIRELAEWDESCIPDGSAIICRNNAPLFTIGLRLLSRGRHIKLIGMDIGAGLVRSLKKLGPPTLDARQMASAIALWQSDALQSAKSAAMVYEKAECLTVLCAERYAGWTLGDAIKYAEDLFKQDGPIQLLSGHKAKGLEWDTVIHLDPWRVPSRFAKLSEEVEQELNIKYVIETRFKQELILVDTRGWQ